MTTLREALAQARARLTKAGVDSPRLSAQVLAAHVIAEPRTRMLSDLDRYLDEERLDAYLALVDRRARGEPVAYILGEKEFYGLAFAVSAAVLIPRPETEHVVELALARFGSAARIAFADLGTGSGALAVTLAAHLPRARGLAVDLCPDALAVARANARRHGVAGRLLFARADFGRLPAPVRSLDLLVANPPYVAEVDYPCLSPEVARFEPCRALVGGPDGVEQTARLAAEARRCLKPGGLALVEIGADRPDRAEQALALFPSSAGWREAEVVADLAGLPRVVRAVA
jgi:release factor glutamine methyltransferase